MFPIAKKNMLSCCSLIFMDFFAFFSGLSHYLPPGEQQEAEEMWQKWKVKNLSKWMSANKIGIKLTRGREGERGRFMQNKRRRRKRTIFQWARQIVASFNWIIGWGARAAPSPPSPMQLAASSRMGTTMPPPLPPPPPTLQYTIVLLLLLLLNLGNLGASSSSPWGENLRESLSTDYLDEFSGEWSKNLRGKCVNPTRQP